MATMVDRPQSILRESAATIPHRRSHPEIIDVDSLDDDEVQPPRRVRARREPVEVIDISDDEDTDFPVASSSHTNRAHGRLFSPPPRFDTTPIPPIPPLPPGLAAHTSLPMRRHPPPHPVSTGPIVEPPVRAHDRTFDFEMSFGPGSSPHRLSPPRPSGSGSSSRQRSNRSSRASSPSVVIPPRLGLGGALISSNNARLAEERQAAIRRRQSAEQRAREHAYQRTLRAVHNARGMGGFHLGLGPYRNNDMADLYLELGRGGGLADWHERLFPELVARREDVEYKKEYTHPGKAEAGFTFDFSASEEDVAQEDGQQFPATSVDNPIVIDDEEDLDKGKGKGKAVAPAESSSLSLTLKTVLVCSHCRDPLLLGESASRLGPEAAKDRRIWSMRCGHLIDGKCLRTLSAPPVAEPFDPSGKGKGKALEPQPFEAAREPTSIRSRLRSYIPSMSMFGPSGSAPTVKKDVVEGTHEWECPVANCGRRHTSVKVGGVWGPPKPGMHLGEGPIGVFV